jgi:hypothetical protein
MLYSEIWTLITSLYFSGNCTLESVWTWEYSTLLWNWQSKLLIFQSCNTLYCCAIVPYINIWISTYSILFMLTIIQLCDCCRRTQNFTSSLN